MNKKMIVNVAVLVAIIAVNNYLQHSAHNL